MKLFLILILQLLWIGIFPQVPQNSLKLPTPTSEFFKSINLNSRITIEEYIKTYFSGGKHIKVLDSTAWDTDGTFGSYFIFYQKENKSWINKLIKLDT
jgi:hypothetical protein